jgi:hypothetical protein
MRARISAQCYAGRRTRGDLVLIRAAGQRADDRIEQCRHGADIGCEQRAQRPSLLSRASPHRPTKDERRYCLFVALDHGGTMTIQFGWAFYEHQLETTMTTTTNLRDSKMVRLVVIGVLAIIVAYLLYSVL